MSIIIEGPDCSGKSTLILEEFNDMCVIHNGRYPSPMEAFKAYLGQCPSPQYNHNNIVWDRNYPSEQIYGRIYRSKNIPQEDIDVLEKHLADIKTVIVLCCPPQGIIIDNWRKLKQQRNEYIENESYFQDIVREYDVVFNSYVSLPVIHYDYMYKEFNKSHPIKERIEKMRTTWYDGSFNKGIPNARDLAL